MPFHLSYPTDEWNTNEWGEEPSKSDKSPAHTQLACLDDIFTEIESGDHRDDPWKHYPTLKALLKDRLDWDSDFPMIEVNVENCLSKKKSPCTLNSTVALGPRESETGELFDAFHNVWKEEDEAMVVKREQLQESFWNTNVPNILNHTWE